MSSNTAKKIAGWSGAGLAACAAGALIVSSFGAAGANFSDTNAGDVSIDAATLVLDVSDSHGNNGTFDLKFPNLAPGQTKTEVIKVKNSGSINGTAKLAFAGGESFVVPTGQQPDVNQLTFAINGGSAVPAPQLASGSIALGTVAPGQTKSVTVTVGLASGADNNWQGVRVGAKGAVTLEQ